MARKKPSFKANQKLNDLRTAQGHFQGTLLEFFTTLARLSITFILILLMNCKACVTCYVNAKIPIEMGDTLQKSLGAEATDPMM